MVDTNLPTGLRAGMTQQPLLSGGSRVDIQTTVTAACVRTHAITPFTPKETKDAMSHTLRICALIASCLSAPLAAEDADPVAGIAIELNALAPQDSGCLLSFVVQNGHTGAISHAVFEAVLFNGTGQVHQLTLFDFGELPPARPRVRQFIVPSLACSEVSRIIFNGAATCTSDDLAPSACLDGLILHSRTDTEVLG